MWPSTPDRDPGLMWPPQPVGAGQPMGLLARQQPRGGLLGAGMAPGGGGGLLRPGRPVLGALGNNANALLMMGMGMLSGQGNKDAWGRGAAGFQAGSGMDMSRREEKRLEDKLKKEAEQQAMRQAVLAKLTPGAFPEWDALPDVMKEFALVDDDFLNTVMTDIAGSRINPDDPPDRWVDEGNGQRNTVTGKYDPFPAAADQAAPTTREFFDPATGANIMKEWNPQSRQWVEVGFGEPPSGMTFESDGDGGFRLTEGPIGGARGPNQDTIKNRQLYSIVQPDLSIINQTYDAMTNLANQAGALLPDAINNFATSEDYQRSQNALLNIIANSIYSVSGAQAPEAEVQRQASILTPKPGESAASIADKKARIERMVEGIRIRAQMEGPGGGGAPDADGWQDRGNGVRIRRID